MSLFETGIGLSLANDVAVYNEIWLAESMKIAWSIWSNLGWNKSSEMKILKTEWNIFRAEEWKLNVIDKIARFNRISRRLNFDINSEYEQGWLLVLEIVALIKQQDVYLENADEVYHFRLLVVKFMATGIMKGLNQKDVDNSEIFIFTTRSMIDDFPFYYHTDVDVTFCSRQGTTKITAIDSSVPERKLQCNRFSVCVSDP